MGLGLTGTLGAATRSTIPVTALIVPGCLVVGGTSAFGLLDFGTRSALSTATVSTSLGGTTVTLQCTPGVVLRMSLDGGQHSSDGTRHLRRNGASQMLAYQLYRDTGYSQALDIGQAVQVGYTDPTAIKLPVHGRVQLSGRLPAGTYTDVVQVTVSW